MYHLCRMLSIAVLLALVFFPLTATAVEQVAKTEKKVVKVGNLVINQGDVDLRAQKILPMQVSFHGGLDEEKVTGIKQKALDELIERAYKVQYAIDEEISIDAASFDAEWQKKLSKNKRLSDNIHTPQADKIKADLYLDMLAGKAESVAVDDNITVTDDDVATYYVENKARYLRPKQFTASHIFVKVDPSDNTEEQEVKRVRAEALLKRALDGEDFYNLAYYESDDRSRYVGGSLGSFHAGQTVTEFDAAIQNMAPDEIVGPVRTIYGFHVIKLDAVEEQRQLKLDEVSGNIRASLVGAERGQIYEQWMSKLKEKYPLERFSQ